MGKPSLTTGTTRRRRILTSTIAVVSLLALVLMLVLVLVRRPPSPNTTTTTLARADTAATDKSWCRLPKRFLPLPPPLTSEKESKVTALASWPGSGNTWLRVMVEEGTRVYTGSVYDGESLRAAFPGENHDGATTIAVKTHHPCSGSWGTVTFSTDCDRAHSSILVVRNPFNAMKAEFNREETNANHTGFASAEAVMSDRFFKFVQHASISWRKHTVWYLFSRPTRSFFGPNEVVENDEWLDGNGLPVLFFLYEDLTDATKRTSMMRRAFAFLKRMRVPPDDHVSRMDPVQAAACVDAAEADTFHRKKGAAPKAAALDPFARMVRFRKPEWGVLWNWPYPVDEPSWKLMEKRAREEPNKKWPMRDIVCAYLGHTWIKEAWGECTTTGPWAEVHSSSSSSSSLSTQA